MRVNVYAEEMTEKIDIISKVIDGQAFTGLRLYLHLPVTINPEAVVKGEQPVNMVGPFIHRLNDDDSAAITFWGKKDLRTVLQLMLDKLDTHYGIPRP